jgi:hypothetical protein
MDGKLHILNVSKETAAKIFHWQRHGGLVQDVVPELTAEQRELLLTGIDDEEWNRIFPPEKATAEIRSEGFRPDSAPPTANCEHDDYEETDSPFDYPTYKCNRCGHTW